MALLPALLLLSLLSSYLSLRHGVEDALDLLSYVLPEQSESTIGDLVKIIRARSVGLFSIGFLLTVGLASNTLSGITTSVDTAYGTAEARAAWITRIIAFGMTTVIGSLSPLTIHLTSFGPVIEGLALRTLLKWSLATLVDFGVFEMLYVLAPSGPHSGRFILPGAIVATAIS